MFWHVARTCKHARLRIDMHARESGTASARVRSGASRIPVARGQQHGYYSVSAMELRPTSRTELEPGMFHPTGRKVALCDRHEQEKLSGVVKRVHRKLRRKYIEGKAVSQPS